MIRSLYFIPSLAMEWLERSTHGDSTTPSTLLSRGTWIGMDLPHSLDQFLLDIDNPK